MNNEMHECCGKHADNEFAQLSAGETKQRISNIIVGMQAKMLDLQNEVEVLRAKNCALQNALDNAHDEKHISRAFIVFQVIVCVFILIYSYKFAT
jgi:hypothetical protein